MLNILVGTDKFGNDIFEPTDLIEMSDWILVYCKKCKLSFKVEAQAHLDGLGCPVCDRQASELYRVLCFEEN